MGESEYAVLDDFLYEAIRLLLLDEFIAFPVHEMIDADITFVYSLF